MDTAWRRQSRQLPSEPSPEGVAEIRRVQLRTSEISEVDACVLGLLGDVGGVVLTGVQPLAPPEVIRIPPFVDDPARWCQSRTVELVQPAFDSLLALPGAEGEEVRARVSLKLGPGILAEWRSAFPGEPGGLELADLFERLEGDHGVSAGEIREVAERFFDLLMSWGAPPPRVQGAVCSAFTAASAFMTVPGVAREQHWPHLTALRAAASVFETAARRLRLDLIDTCVRQTLSAWLEDRSLAPIKVDLDPTSPPGHWDTTRKAEQGHPPEQLCLPWCCAKLEESSPAPGVV